MNDKELPSDDLTRALFERLQEESVECSDPYDLYVNRIKSSVFGDPNGLSERIEEGYRLIVEDITRSN